MAGATCRAGAQARRGAGAGPDRSPSAGAAATARGHRFSNFATRHARDRYCHTCACPRIGLYFVSRKRGADGLSLRARGWSRWVLVTLSRDGSPLRMIADFVDDFFFVRIRVFYGRIFVSDSWECLYVVFFFLMFHRIFKFKSDVR